LTSQPTRWASSRTAIAPCPTQAEHHQLVVPEIVAAQAREAVRQDAAFENASNSSLTNCGRSAPAAASACSKKFEACCCIRRYCAVCSGRACRPNRHAVETVGRHVWVGGADPTNATRLAAPAAQLVSARNPASDEMKQEWRQAGHDALKLGVFGALNVEIDGRLFWGLDGLDMAAAALHNDPGTPPRRRGQAWGGSECQLTGANQTDPSRDDPVCGSELSSWILAAGPAHATPASTRHCGDTARSHKPDQRRKRQRQRSRQGHRLTPADRLLYVHCQTA